MFVFFFLLLLILWRLGPQPKRVERMISQLEIWERAARRHPRERLPAGRIDGPDFFSHAVVRGLRQGESMSERVGILRATCRTALRYENRRRRLWLLPLCRAFSFIGILVAVVTTLGLSPHYANKLTLVGCWVFAGALLWRRLLGPLWVWEEEGTSWWAAVLSFHEKAGDQWRQLWLGMQRMARRRGEAASPDWERVLQDWAEKRHRREEARLERLEESLVLWELGVCLPAAIFLLSGPLLEMLEPVLKSL